MAQHLNKRVDKFFLCVLFVDECKTLVNISLSLKFSRKKVPMFPILKSRVQSCNEASETVRR